MRWSVTLLESVDGPAEVKRLNHGELSQLAQEIRDLLVEKVRLTGGHLGPNLGVVELTLALHRVFDSPWDAIVWDVGHQSYVHKIITGRRRDFDLLRQRGGLSGYPDRGESDHDLVENSHASTALSYVDGLTKAFRLAGQERHAVAVVGDGALTGGMCWEALNNIATQPRRPVVIVINDNGRSYSPTIGGFAEHLASLRSQPVYERIMDGGRELLGHVPLMGKPFYTALHAAKAGIKDALSPQTMFSDLGIKYLGPIDGHDIAALEKVLHSAKSFGGPVIVHAVTEKGHGYAPAVNNQADQMHQTDPIDPDTGEPPPKGPGWTSVFGEELARLGAEREDLVAITAAMSRSTGLEKFASDYPDRWFDVGIAEQHAVTSAAGLAMGGFHPVVALYSTFLNRAFDQVLMDVALHRQPVTLVLDRAGITGPDGASHHGMWDLSLLGMVPGIQVAAPRDAETVREELREAVNVSDGPTALRFSRGSVPESIQAIERIGKVDVLSRAKQNGAKQNGAEHGSAKQHGTGQNAEGDPGSDVLLIAVGAFAKLGLAAAERLADQGIGVTVVDPRWVLPVPRELVSLARSYRMVVTVEDNGRHGGFGSALAAVLRDDNCPVPLRDLAIPQRFLRHGSRDEVLAEIGLTAQDVAREIIEWSVSLSAEKSAESLPSANTGS
jgi:1-deoxy-D-xylulose-5-phosphate synthase